MLSLAHRNRSDFSDLRLRCPSRTPEIAAMSETRESNAAWRFKGAMEVASGLRFQAAISEPQHPSCCGISGDLAPSTRKSLAIAIVRFWCAKVLSFFGGSPLHERNGSPLPTRGFRGALQKNDTCLTPFIAVHGVTAQVSFSCGCEGRFRGDSAVHMNLLALKGCFESDTWTR